tara:strand:- start:4 stop:474 length:471 start_codon:yes stop_codon:yes gene_type:complete
MKTINICLLGDDAVGKTAYINALRGKSFIINYIPTVSCDIYDTKFNYNDETYNIIFTDTPGNLDNITKHYDAVILFLLSFNNKTINNALEQYKIVKELFNTIPIAVVNNKTDCFYDDIKSKKDIQRMFKDTGYMEISCKCCINLNSPIEYIIKKLY